MSENTTITIDVEPECLARWQEAAKRLRYSLETLIYVGTEMHIKQLVADGELPLELLNWHIREFHRLQGAGNSPDPE